MATILSEKKSSYGSPYAFYTVSVSQISRTPTSAKIKVTCTAHLQYSQSYFLTGTGYGLVAGIYIGGLWHDFTIKKTSESWRGTGKHSVSATFTVSAGITVATLSGIKFRVKRSSGSDTACKLNETSCSNIGITKISTNYDNVKITAEAVDQTKVKAMLSGLPANVGYATTINWYIDGKLTATQTRAASAETTTAEYTLTNCLPNTIYAINAVVKYEDTVITTKSVNAVTPQETGVLTITPKATYVVVSVSGMFDEPNYTRSVVIYYKKSSDGSYVKYSTLESQGTSVQTSVLKLLSNQSYDFKVEIKNGEAVLRTLTDKVATIKDTSLIPTAHISGVVQNLGTRNCLITWLTDKIVAGTKYSIQAKVDGVWTTIKSLSSVSSPVTIVSPSGNTDVVFRITSTNSTVAAGVTNVSDEYTFYVRDDFVWDVPKTVGTTMIITANEWNRLRDYVYAKNGAAQIPLVREGERITAVTYNRMKNAIAAFASINISDKRAGDVIKASDIDALRIAVNE